MWWSTVASVIRSRLGNALLEKLNALADDLVVEPLPIVQTPLRGDVQFWHGLHLELSNLRETLFRLGIQTCEHLAMHVAVVELLQGRPGGK